MQERAKSLAIGVVLTVGHLVVFDRYLAANRQPGPQIHGAKPHSSCTLVFGSRRQPSGSWGGSPERAFIWLHVLDDLPQNRCERDRAWLDAPAPTLVDIAEGE